MQNYVENAMKITERLGLGSMRRDGDENNQLQSSNKHAKETLTLSGTMSENGEHRHPNQGQSNEETYSEGDDGELSQTSNEEGDPDMNNPGHVLNDHMNNQFNGVHPQSEFSATGESKL